LSDLPDVVEGVPSTSLVELVNRVVDRGVSLSGDLTISVAEVDLLHIGLRLVLRSVADEEADAAAIPGTVLARRIGEGV
jgi:hypothetical protein